jgi:hypothetical protein
LHASSASSCIACGRPVSRSAGRRRGRCCRDLSRRHFSPIRCHSRRTSSLPGRVSATARFFLRRIRSRVEHFGAEAHEDHDAASSHRPRREQCTRQCRMFGREAKSKRRKIRKAGPDRTSLPPSSAVSRPSLRWPPKRRPALTRPARVGVSILRSGRGKACGAVKLGK